jgi:hypothetical protein
MLIRRPRPASATHKWVYWPAGGEGGGGDIELRKNTYNMRLDSQSIKLLLVITPGFGRVIGDEEDAFVCKERTKGSDRAGEGSAGEGKREWDEHEHVRAELVAPLRTLAA